MVALPHLVFQNEGGDLRRLSTSRFSREHNALRTIDGRRDEITIGGYR